MGSWGEPWGTFFAGVYGGSGVEKMVAGQAVWSDSGGRPCFGRIGVRGLERVKHWQGHCF